MRSALPCASVAMASRFTGACFALNKPIRIRCTGGQPQVCSSLYAAPYLQLPEQREALLVSLLVVAGRAQHGRAALRRQAAWTLCSKRATTLAAPLQDVALLLLDRPSTMPVVKLLGPPTPSNCEPRAHAAAPRCAWLAVHVMALIGAGPAGGSRCLAALLYSKRSSL